MASRFATRHRTTLCFSDAEIRLDAGEALGSIAPGQRFRGRRMIVHRDFDTAIGNVKSELRRARLLADDSTRPVVHRIAQLAHAGIREIRRHPWLVIHGGIDAFRRADAAAARARLRHCLS